MDDMMNSTVSHTTYIVTRRNDGLLLSDIEAPKPLLIMDEEDDLNHNYDGLLSNGFESDVTTSMVLDKASVDVRLLPVVDSEEEVSTPLVDASNNILSFALANQAATNTTTNASDKPLPPQPQNQAPDQSTTVLNAPSPSAKSESEKSEKGSDKGKSPRTEKAVDPAADKTKKKHRPSLMEAIASSPAPAPRPPKPPSKSQLMMERLKASIEQDKNRPKKEVKSRLGFTGTAPANGEVDQENAPSEVKQVNGTAATPTPKKPLSSVNTNRPAALDKTAKTKPAESKSSSSAVVKKAPSQTSVADKSARPASVHHDKTKAPTAPTRPAAKPDDKRMDTATRRPLTSKPTSAQAVGKSAVAAKKAEACKALDDARKKRIEQNAKAFSVLTILYNRDQLEKESLDSILKCAQARLRDQDAFIEKLSKESTSTVNKYETEIAEINRKHAALVDELKASHEKEVEGILLKAKKDLDTELEKVHRQHRYNIDDLDHRLSEAEKRADALREEKLALQKTLEKDENDKIKELMSEISSLQIALELKSDEMKELRHQNRNLQLQVDVIPDKDIQIRKLTHRVDELKLTVAQQLEHIKKIGQEYDELSKSMRASEVMSESVVKENDILRYRLGEVDASPRLNRLHQSINPIDSSTPRSSRRDKMSKSLHADGSPTRSPTRSLVSVYQECGRKKLNFAQDDDDAVIYAPEGTFACSGGKELRPLGEAEPQAEEAANDPEADS
ncbi:Protein M01A8.2 a [Aphelenchoides avenae]|nr:Protein M01A8.2 a [Aphelenchus avenae]